MVCNQPVNSVSGDRVYRGNRAVRTQCVQTAAVFEATWSVVCTYTVMAWSITEICRRIFKVWLRCS